MELWKDIAGFEGLYQISSKSRVKSLPHLVHCMPGNAKRLVKGTVLKHVIVGGYPSVTLSNGPIQTRALVHVLVATYFIPNPLNLPQVNHKNGIKTDPRKENLEWCTPSENVRHAWATGLHSTNVAIVAINKKTKEHKYFNTLSDASRGLNVDRASVSKVAAGKRKSIKDWSILKQLSF